jgi:hypothetical protein
MMSFGRFTWGDGLAPDPDALYATFTLRNTQSLSGQFVRRVDADDRFVHFSGGAVCADVFAAERWAVCWNRRTQDSHRRLISTAFCSIAVQIAAGLMRR